MVQIGKVAGQIDDHLQAGEKDESSQAHLLLGEKDAKYGDQFHKKHEGCGSLMKPEGKFMHKPGDSVRDGLRLIVISKGRQVAPIRIPAEQFDNASLKVE